MTNVNAYRKMETGEITKACEAVKHNGVKLQASIQLLAAHCIMHTIADRNITPCQQLFDALPDSMRQDALVKHFELFGNVAWMKSAKGKDHKVQFFGVQNKDGTEKLPREAATPEYFQIVLATRWDQAKRKPEPTSIHDAVVEVDRLLERLAKLAGRGTEVKGAALLPRLDAVVKQFQNEQFMANLNTKEVEDYQIMLDARRAAVQAAAEKAAAAETEAKRLAGSTQQ